MKLFNLIAATLVVLLTSFGGVSAQETQPVSKTKPTIPTIQAGAKWHLLRRDLHIVDVPNDTSTALERCFSYKGHHASDFFNHIYLSYRLHLLKPDAEIFEYVLQDANIRPEETLFIDDAIPNCRTAESLGFHTYTPQPREDWSHLFEFMNHEL